MRHLIVATGILVFAASSHAQSPAAGASTDPSAPPLTKTVVVNATDSPLVRAAKLAVASRQHPSNRRVITVTVGGTAGRGRLAQATGPVNGPNLPPAAVPATPDPAWEQRAQATAKREAEVKQRMRQLAQQEQVVGAEIDEPYGGDIEEDAVEQRLSEISGQRQGQPPPPPNK